MTATVINMECLAGMSMLLADNSIDAIVTDPPYGLSKQPDMTEVLRHWLAGDDYVHSNFGFMGKSWDSFVPGPSIWRECLRVLKPGGHLLAFAGTRTMDLMGLSLRLAGFELRDSIGYAHDDESNGAPLLSWCYGSGFPKNLDVSKAIDKVNGEAGRLYKFTEYMRSTGLAARQINEVTGTFMGSHYLTDKSQPAIPTPELWAIIRPLCGYVPDWVDGLVDRIAAEREVVGQKIGKDPSTVRLGMPLQDGTLTKEYDITAPATDAAKQWAGWGTALKPAWEPILIARKPLAGTVAENVQQFGTGAINVDGCRVEAEKQTGWGGGAGLGYHGGTDPNGGDARPADGRWPANFAHDGSEAVVGLFPVTTSGGGPKPGTPRTKASTYGDPTISKSAAYGSTTGSAARFFYCAKASKRDRDEGCEALPVTAAADMVARDPDSEGMNSPRAGAGRTSGARNHHPTVKPTELMRWLVRLVTPPGGTVLDPFTGSGSTGKAAVLEGFEFMGFEMDPDYHRVAEARIAHAERSRK